MVGGRVELKSSAQGAATTNRKERDGMAEQTGSVNLQVPALGASAGLGNPLVRTSIAIDLSPEATRSLNELMKRTGDSPSDLFRKALGLYKLAEEAKREGKAVGIAATPDGLETEFVGL
jgi:hypothetical protein